MKKFISSLAVVAALSAVTIVQAAESFGGLGISVYTGKKGVSVVAVLPNSPAEQVGLQAGDVIVSVNGTSLSSIAPENQVSLLRGNAGSSIDLLVQRNGEDVNLSTKRASISVQDLEMQDISAWFGKSQNLTAEEINYLASQKIDEGYELLGVLQNGHLINSVSENLNSQAVQHISVKKEVEKENYAPSVPKTVGGLNFANRETLSFSVANSVNSARLSVLNIKGATVWQRSFDKIPAGVNNVYWNGANLPSGSYNVRLETGSTVSAYRFELR